MTVGEMICKQMVVLPLVGHWYPWISFVCTIAQQIYCGKSDIFMASTSGALTWVTARFWSYPFTLGYLQATYLKWFTFVLVSSYTIYIDICLYKNKWLSHKKWSLYRYFKFINLILGLIYIFYRLLIYL